LLVLSQQIGFAVFVSLGFTVLGVFINIHAIFQITLMPQGSALAKVVRFALFWGSSEVIAVVCLLVFVIIA
jgi:hypothetical protein